MKDITKLELAGLARAQQLCGAIIAELREAGAPQIIVNQVIILADSIASEIQHRHIEENDK